MSKSTRKQLLFAVLAATLGLAIWTHERQGDGAEPAAVRQPEAQTGAAPVETASGTATLALDQLGKREPVKTDADPFVPKTWYVPPPAPPPEPPPKPTAPPLPFQYVGKFEDAQDKGKAVIYLAKGNDAYSVKPGDTLDGQYRFEGLERGVLVFTYLPLAIRQTLPLQRE
jgi:hypothetical protein